MRLTQIKLSGFKSFVDTTVIPTPSQLVGVVGPNGCGKSNIIDAVRWVLGESRASELRGGSMQDVIFNGSGQRKPAARASVELTFENNEGRIVGQWGSYAEISVRRELTRDGSSGYFINGQQVRRRDINDIFLGTGLGARGYAIIGQGMINRLIEARPEELRVYLEEAAGVSRYKERRRETESRLRDTRENLTRLEDILQELEQQLIRLEAQAEVAKTYRALQAEGEQKQHVLWWLREKNARQEQKQHFLAIEQAQTAVEAAMADIRSTQTRLEQLRQQHLAITDEVQKAQQALFQSNATVSRIEAEIHHANTAQTRLEQRQAQLQAQQKEWEQLHEDSAQELAHKQEELEDAALLIEESLAQLEEILTRVEPAEAQQQQKQGQIATLSAQLQQAKQQQALAQQRIDSLQQQRSQLELRQQRFEQDLLQVQADTPVDVVDLKENWEQTQRAQQQEQHAVVHLEAQMQQQQAQQKQAATALQEQERERTQIQAQLDALQALQTQVQQQGKLTDWLQDQGLAGSTRLWQLLQVQPGWEQAIEAVLGQRLNAVALTEWQALQQLPSLPPARLWFMQPTATEMTGEEVPAGLRPLIELVTVQDARWQQTIAQALAGYYVATDLQAALSTITRLPPQVHLVVAEGHIVQAHQVLLYAPDAEQAGVLARQQAIEQQHKALVAQQVHVDAATEALERAQSGYMATQQAHSKTQTRWQDLVQQAHELQLLYQQAEQRNQQQQQREQQLQRELQEIQEQQAELVEQIEETALQGEDQALFLAEHEEQLIAWQDELQQANEQLRLLREQQREAEQKSERLKYEQGMLQARVDELLRSRQQAADLGRRTQAELAGLVDEYEQVDVQELHGQLQEALELRVEHEEAHQEIQKRQSEMAAQLHDLEHNQHQTGDGIEPLRQKVMELQLAEQAARMTVEQYAEQLDSHQVDRQALAVLVQEQNADWQKVTWLQSEVQRVNRAVEALGAVNLAALEELQTAQERQFYLQSQHDDLTLAIETLEDAIRKIDRETRALLQNTFNEVNTHFGELFPRLFGGGEAKLIMTGDEVLDAGVQVMAQPPGKRNSTIQLLSGGEKALTATALVFAFFKLNPAPFCLLDEVDAPLDDANTERYAKLVQSMSDQTQFLFISHNKIAMHMAKQLVGVTMQEQGVSRIVAVDMAAAVEMTH